MDEVRSFQNLLDGTASEEEIKLLKQGLSSGQIPIGGNVNQSVILIGSGNSISLTPDALDRLDARPLLGGLERDLTGKEIDLGLCEFEKLIKKRSPISKKQFEVLSNRLRAFRKTDIKTMSATSQHEYFETLATINSLCMEVTDISFYGLCLGEEPPEYDSRSPFRGLESFRPEDAEFFFGRNTLAQKLLEKINSHPFLAVLGASGSGKSSLVMAGVIPMLHSKHFIFRPGSNPIPRLDTALSQREKTLIVIDQFEELFTLTIDKSVQQEFITRLMNNRFKYRIILTFRSDFLGEVAEYSELNEEVQNHLVNVPPMNIDELRLSMEKQAEKVGLRFETDLSSQILEDVATEPGAMPLLQHALWELWNRRHGRWLKVSEYRMFGGVKKAITKTADSVFDSCSQGEKDYLQDIFLRLTHLDESSIGRDTSRRVSLDSLIPSKSDHALASSLLDKLTKARLIVKSSNNDQVEVEVAHEALIRHWDRLRSWLIEDRENLILRERISEDAAEWKKMHEVAAYLNHRGPKLDMALALRNNPRHHLTSIELEYLKACEDLKQREQSLTMQRRRVSFAVALVVVLVLVTILTGWGVSSNRSASINATQVTIANTAQVAAEIAKNNAEEKTRIARAAELAARSAALRERNFQLSLLLGVESYRTYQNPQTTGAILDGVTANPHLIQYLTGHQGWIGSVAISPDGTVLASGSEDNTIILWDLKSFKPIGEPLKGHFDSVFSIAFSPDGKLLASGSADTTIILWDLETKKPISTPLIGHEDVITSVAFRPDGKILASGSNDGTVIFWNTETLQLIKSPLAAHQDAVRAVAFSPNGKFLVSGSRDNTVIVWDVDARKPIGNPLTGHSDWVRSVTFSPNGNLIASGSDDGTVILWDARTRQMINSPLTGHTDVVKTVVFSPDGSILASGSEDNTIILWDVDSHKPIGDPLRGHSNWVNSLVFSLDGKKLISGSFDRSIIIWDLSRDNTIGRVLEGHQDAVRSVAFDPNGKILATSSDDETIIFWDVNSGSPLGEPLSGSDSIRTVAFSPDGKILASGSEDGVVILWDTSTRQPISSRSVIRLEGGVKSLVFSPDGKKLLSGGSDGVVMIWDVETQKKIGLPLAGHSAAIRSLAITPDGQYLASGSEDATIIIWNMETYQPVGEPLNSHFDVVKSVAFNADGTILASCSEDNTIIFWDANTLQPLAQPLTGHSDWVNTISFKSNEKILASGGYDEKIILWDTALFQQIGQPFEGMSEILFSLSFSPDGKLLASGGGNGNVTIWNMDVQSWLYLVCERTGRNLTSSEWQEYFPGETYRKTCPQWSAG